MLKYWLWLATKVKLSARDKYRVVQHFASPEEAYFAGEKDYARIKGLRSFKELMNKELAPAEETMRRCSEKKIRIITMQDAAYPRQLLNLEDPPVVLYCVGAMQDLNVPMLAVVGTRRSTLYGCLQAKKISYTLSRSGCAIVSGGALGVDTEALLGAVYAGGPAVAVLGGGLDRIYPAENRGFFRQLALCGCLISEYPPGTPAHKFHFPARNRIISGMSMGVLVTEAPAKSGALITANRALEQGRDVFVLPANVGVESCEGNLKLLRDGAIMVTQPKDILQEYLLQYPQILKESDEQIPEHLLYEKPSQPTAEEPVPTEKEEKVIDKEKTKAYIDLKDIEQDLKEEELALLRLLCDGPVHVDLLADRTGMTVSAALALLTMMQVRGIVCRPSSLVFELAEK